MTINLKFSMLEIESKQKVSLNTLNRELQITKQKEAARERRSHTRNIKNNFEKIQLESQKKKKIQKSRR